MNVNHFQYYLFIEWQHNFFCDVLHLCAMQYFWASTLVHIDISAADVCVTLTFVRSLVRLALVWIKLESTLKQPFLCVLDFGPGQLTSFMFILCYEAGFYKPTVLKIHPPISGITAHATMPGSLEHSIISCWSNEWCLKNGLLGRGFEPTTFQSWIFCLNH